ncbi:MAG TPA: hypothetical protein P5203_20260 [Spirochaetota bacterium]|nr:hypothetical protein [Spirochaetota bacterium]HRT77449.1 hypothetical protein [Spirochaetota bacterium]
MKLTRKILYFAPIMAMVIITNYIIDPAYIYHGYEKKIAGLLLEGKHVALTMGFTEGKILINYINNTAEKFDIIVMGSSRAMPISSSSFPGKTFHNFSVSSASLSNLIAIHELLQRNRLQYKTVIFALDPSLVFAYQPARHADLDGLYLVKRNKLLYVTSMAKHYYDFAFEILSFSYFQSSMRAYFDMKGPLDKRYYVAKNLNNNDLSIILCDGSRKWEKRYNEATKQQAREEAEKYIRKFLTGCTRTHLDAAMKHGFESLVKSLKESGADVIFWFPPYHPMVFKKYASDCPALIDAQTYYLETARKNNIRVYGSYNPDEYGFKETDFFDYHHLKNEPAYAHMVRMSRALGL